MLGNYTRDGEHVLRPQVTAFLFSQAVEMWKKYRRRRWLGAATMIAVLLTF